MSRLRIRHGGAWLVVYPETTIDQIQDIKPIGKKLLELEETGFIRIDGQNAIEMIAPGAMRDAIGAAPLIHEHDTSQISDLSTFMAAYVLLDAPGGKVPLSSLPAAVIGGLKRKGAITGNVITLGSTLPFLAHQEDWGSYWIMTQDTTVTYNSSNYVFENRDDGDMTNPVGENAQLLLEAGDWLVYSHHTNPGTPASGVFKMGVINNTYPLAETNSPGIVSLTTGNITTRGGLSEAGVNAQRVIDEYSLRKLIKEVSYGSSAPSDPIDGDIWYETD